MKNEINAVLENMTTATPEPEDYTGEDGLLYCGKCRKPKEAYFAPDKAAIFGRDRHPAECDCQRAAREEREAAEKRRRHLDTVEELKRRGFTDPTMRDWTFENDNGRNPQAGIARRYVEHWEDMRADNIGCLFWGGVGTGKSYLAGCIANALMEKEIPVHMTNFALILNDLAASFEGRNEYISRLCRYPLLILDDFGMERLSDSQLLFFFRLLSHDLQIEEVLTVCLFKWTDLRLLCRTANGSFFVKQRHRPKQEATLTLQQIQSATAALDYLRTFPTFPTRINKIGKARPLEADFQGVPFSTFISCDNYYQGFLQSKDEERLKDLTLLLYPRIKPRCLTRPILYCAFYWFASLKQYFARLFPHFLQPMSADEQNLLGYAPPIGEMLRQSMNAQIRALTGGDITKEDAVLNMDTWRALTELDAKAKEAEDIKRQTK